MKHLLITIFTLYLTTSVYAQTETEKIKETLTHYIEGTANGEPERLKIAFHSDFNLYFVSKDSLKVWPGKNYVARIKQGVKSNRIGKIVSIDYEGNAASAKIKIDMPDKKRIYTDYLLLLKIEGSWKIIQKSFTYRKY